MSAFPDSSPNRPYVAQQTENTQLAAPNQDQFNCSDFLNALDSDIKCKDEEETNQTKWKQQFSQPILVENESNIQSQNSNNQIQVEISKQNFQNEQIFEKEIFSISKNLSKIEKWRSLLPYFYRAKLTPFQREILSVSQTIDRHLFNCKKAGYMDNVYNIINKENFQAQKDEIIHITKIINFLQPNFYKICSDPLGNLALGFGSKPSKINIRKQRLRKSLVDYLQKQENENETSQTHMSGHNKGGAAQTQLIQREFEVRKTSKFYPELNHQIKHIPKSTSHKKTKRIQSQLKEIVHFESQSLKQFQDSILQHQQEQSTLKQRVAQQNFHQIRNQIPKIYKQRQVSSMFKISLVKQLQKRFKVQPKGQIIKSLKIVLQEELSILEPIPFGNSFILNLRSSSLY